MTPDGRVSVVVATRDRVDSLSRALAHLDALPERPPVVVVDNASSDGTAAAVRARFPRVEVVELAANAGARARTIGAERVTTSHVAFSDDDSWWAPGSLSRAADALDGHPQIGLVAARILVGPEEREDPTCSAMAQSRLPWQTDLPGRPILGFVACGAVVRRSAFLDAGGFHPRLGVYGEEQLLAVDLVRAGWRLVYLPEVVAHHHPARERDEGQRGRVEARNALWFAWLRRRGAGAAHATLRVLAGAVRSPAVRAGVADAVRGASWVVRERRAVSRELEVALRAIGG